MKFRWEKKYLYWGITAFLVIVSSISFFLLLNRFNEFAAGVGFLLNLLTPFIMGLALAYLLNPVMEFFEAKCFVPLFRACSKASRRPSRTAGENAERPVPPKKRLRKAKKSSSPQKQSQAPRGLAIAITFLLAVAIVAGLIGLVLPQLVESLTAIVKSFPQNMTKAQNWIIALADSDPDIAKFLDTQFSNASEFVSNWLKNNLLPQLNNVVSGVTVGVMGLVGTVMDIFVGIIVAVYVLFSKEKFLAQTKKMTYALFPVNGANTLVRITRQADGVFGGFIKGKLIDSSIIGLLCFLGMSIFPFLRTEYTLLISVLIGVTNIIPFFGPFIGAIPSAILLLMVDPWKCLWFIIFILILQQVDGNIIGPRILGNSTGLSAFWVIFSIMLFSGFFGFVGMIIGVPAFALIYSLVSDFISNRLCRKELPTETTEYEKIDHIDSMEHEPVYKKPEATE